MRFTYTERHFSTEEEALAEIAERGWCSATLDVVGRHEDFHWHDFDAVIFILSGTAAAEYEDGTVERVGAGTRVETPAGVVHRDAPGTAYRAVFGFAVDPAEMTQPINKPLPVTA
jgi:mannose-6-phosphate isomerase-like protein (cupin superfamily)